MLTMLLRSSTTRRVRALLVPRDPNITTNAELPAKRIRGPTGTL